MTPVTLAAGFPSAYAHSWVNKRIDFSFLVPTAAHPFGVDRLPFLSKGVRTC